MGKSDEEITVRADTLKFTLSKYKDKNKYRNWISFLSGLSITIFLTLLTSNFNDFLGFTGVQIYFIISTSLFFTTSGLLFCFIKFLILEIKYRGSYEWFIAELKGEKMQRKTIKLPRGSDIARVGIEIIIYTLPILIFGIIIGLLIYYSAPVGELWFIIIFCFVLMGLIYASLIVSYRTIDEGLSESLRKY